MIMGLIFQNKIIILPILNRQIANPVVGIEEILEQLKFAIAFTNYFFNDYNLGYEPIGCHV